MEIIEADPYRLCSYGVELEFSKAEQIAESVGIPHDSPMRIRAGITYVLLENANNGHTCLPHEKLKAKVCEYLKITEENFDSAYSAEVEKYTNPRGGQFQAGCYPVSANVLFGKDVAALPDGRLATTPLADGVSARPPVHAIPALRQNSLPSSYSLFLYTHRPS